MRRAAFSSGVRARIGTGGRLREIRAAVVPPAVNPMMTLAPILAARSAPAAATACEGELSTSAREASISDRYINLVIKTKAAPYGLRSTVVEPANVLFASRSTPCDGGYWQSKSCFEPIHDNHCFNALYV